MSQDNGMVIIYDESDFGEYQGAETRHPDSDCWGCREGILNQQGHMGTGGCLYFDDDESIDENEQIIETQSHTGTVDETQDTEVAEEETQEASEVA
jgi:hypothetical protein